jgi:hypothetical protein
MSLHITDDRITSSVTEHHAQRSAEGWEVSWLPGRVFDRNSAITAMSLVEIYVADPPPGDRMWLLAAMWEREIGVDYRKDWR